MYFGIFPLNFTDGDKLGNMELEVNFGHLKHEVYSHLEFWIRHITNKK